MWPHGTAVAYLEHRARFLAPVRAGNTLTTAWTVAGKSSTSRVARGGGASSH